MKKLLLTISLLLSLGLSVSGVAAQVEAPDLESAPSYEDVEGVQSIYDRTFSVDFEAMMASPDSDLDSLDTSALMNMISIQGMTFDSEDNAKAYLDESRTQIESAAEGDPNAMDGIEINELEGFDVDGLHVTMDMPDLGVGASVIIFVDGNMIFQVMVMDADLDTAKTISEEVTQFVIDAEVESEDVSFSDDGTSTGGVFDRMPTAEDEIVGDLTGVMDSEIYVAGE